MTLRIPTPTDFTNYRQTTSLDGQDFVFRILYNEREDTWSFSLLDNEGDPIVQGIKVVVGIPLLRLVTDSRKPPGTLIAIDTTVPAADVATEKTLAEDPGLSDLGESVVLLYFTAEEVAALGLPT